MEADGKTVNCGRPALPQRAEFSPRRRSCFHRGVYRVRVERLTRGASVLQTTLYKYFGDMPGVFRAIAESEANQFDFSFGSNEQSAKDLEGRLIELGTQLLKAIDAPDKVQFDRLVHEQARHHPELAEVYYSALYSRTQDYLSALITLGQAKGLFRPDTVADVLADQLLSMWLGLARTRTVLGIERTTSLDFSERSREAVRTLTRN